MVFLYTSNEPTIILWACHRPSSHKDFKQKSIFELCEVGYKRARR